MILNTQLFDGRTVFIVDNADQIKDLFQIAYDIDSKSNYIIDIGSMRSVASAYSSGIYGKIGDSRMAIRPCCIDSHIFKKSVIFHRSNLDFYKRCGYKVRNFNDMFIFDYTEEFSASEMDISLFF